MAASSVGSIKKHFRKLTDPRVVGRTDHLLVDILVMAICAVIANCNGWRDIALFAKKRATWFKRFLRLANGIPSHYTFRRVFDQLNPRAFQSCLVAWIKEVSDLVGLKHIAIDGKTLRHSGNDGAGLRMLHAVSAWATEQHLLLGQVMTEEKSNEITAIPHLGFLGESGQRSLRVGGLENKYPIELSEGSVLGWEQLGPVIRP